MGLLTDSATTLISLNLGGLEKTLEQILEALQKQDATLRKQEEVLQAHSERLDAIEVGGDYAALNFSVGELSRRLTASEQSQGEFARRCGKSEQAQQEDRRDFEKKLHEEQCNREALEEVVRSLEASCRPSQEGNLGDIQELRDSLYDELRRRCQAFEARVTLAEEKASECRREAKEYRDTVDEREFSASQVQQTLRTIESSTKHAINADKVGDLQKETSMLSRNFESQFRGLETRLEAKVNESVVDAMRSDLEMNGKVLQDAVKVVSQRLSEQEDRLRRLESGQDSAERLRHLVQDAREQQSWRDEGREDGSRCLLCSNDRSLSPTRVIIGSDNLVYAHADTQPEYPGERRHPESYQPIVRPRPTPPSIPQCPPQVVLPSSWEALPGRTGGTAASTSSIPTKGAVRSSGRDVRSKRIGDLVSYPKAEPDSRASSRPSSATTIKTQAPWPSTRPSSAQIQGERGRRGPRPSSAGAYRAPPPSDTLSTSSPSAGDLMLVASQSMPILEKRSDGVETL